MKKQKRSKANEEVFEQQLENLEKMGDIMEQEVARDKENRKIEKDIQARAEKMREDLQNQLIEQNKFGEQFYAQVDDYVFCYLLTEDLKADIRKNGLRYSSMTGNGYETDKPNESIKNLTNINAQMLKILDALELKSPDAGGDLDNDLL